MHNNYIYQYIKNSQTDLTETEELIRDYILNNWDKPFKGKDIARELVISAASVSKYIKKLRFKSIHELNYLRTCNNNDINQYLITAKKQILASTVALNSPYLLQKIVDTFKQKKQIYTYGIGHSYLCSFNFYQRFNKIGLATTIIRERNDVTIFTNKMLHEDCFVVIFSDSALTTEIVNFCAFCNQNKIEYLLITSNPLAEICDSAKYILTYSKPDIGYLLETIGPEEPVIFIIDLLYLTFLYDDYDFALNNFLNNEIYTSFS